MVISAALLGAVTLALASIAAAAPDTLGPSCGNIVGGSFTYNGSALTGNLTTEAPACSRITYTAYVTYDTANGPQTTSGTGTINPDFPTKVGFNVPATDTDGTVCVYLTSSIGNHVIDRAPDTGCIDVSSSPPASSTFS
jgi:hypothetical protein